MIRVVGAGVAAVVMAMLAGGAAAQRFGFVAMFGAATLLALVATGCAWRTLRLETRPAPSPA